MSDAVSYLTSAIRHLDTRIRKLETREPSLQAWQEPPLSNSWANTGGLYMHVGYWKDPSGVVHLGGTISGGTPPSVAFRLPSGYRPEATIAFRVASNATVEISGGGDVDITTAAGLVSLDGISFRADQ